MLRWWQRLQAHEVDLVILAGFMRILTPVFIEPFYRPFIEHSPVAVA